MTFVNSLFPNPRLVADTQVTFDWPNTIVGTGSTEYRIQKMQHYKKKWTWPSRPMATADRRAIQDFILGTAKMSQNSFLYLDPDNHTWDNVTLVTTGTGSNFFLSQKGAANAHPIFHYAGTPVVKLGGVVTAFTQGIDSGTGLPMITVTGATTGSVITISGTYYYAVRYDAGSFSLSMTAMTAGIDGLGPQPWHDTIDNIALVEVFE